MSIHFVLDCHNERSLVRNPSSRNIRQMSQAWKFIKGKQNKKEKFDRFAAHGLHTGSAAKVFRNMNHLTCKTCWLHPASRSYMHIVQKKLYRSIPITSKAWISTFKPVPCTYASHIMCVEVDYISKIYTNCAHEIMKCTWDTHVKLGLYAPCRSWSDISMPSQWVVQLSFKV